LIVMEAGSTRMAEIFGRGGGSGTGVAGAEAAMALRHIATLDNSPRNPRRNTRRRIIETSISATTVGRKTRSAY
jgi:hypothetical protein